MIFYQVDVKSASMRELHGKWYKPGRIWVRGYDEEGVKIYQEHISFVDLRYQGPRCHYTKMLEQAISRCNALNAEESLKVDFSEGACA